MRKKSSWLVSYEKAEQAELRLFCFHCAGGSASSFRNWQKKLPNTVEVLGVQFPGRDERFAEPLFSRLDFLINTLLDEIIPYLDKPYVFFGHSMGASVCFELIRALRSRNINQPLLFVPASRHAPQLPDVNPHIHHLRGQEFIEGLKNYNGMPSVVLDDSELMDLLLPRLMADFELIETYEYQNESPLDCPIVAIGGIDDNTVNKYELLAWGDQTSNQFEYYLFSGDHFFIHNSENEVMDFFKNYLETLYKVS